MIKEELDATAGTGDSRVQGGVDRIQYDFWDI